MIRLRFVLFVVLFLGTLACERSDAGTESTGAAAGATHTSAPDGVQLYAERCASCHGDQGLGDGPAGAAVEAASIAAAEMHERLSDEEIGDIIRMGRGRMPPSGVQRDEEIQALVEFVRTLRQ